MDKPVSVPLDTSQEQQHVFKLYIAGDEQNSRLARENLNSICEEYLKGRYTIEEIDVLIDFVSALKNKIFVTPTLVLMDPEPRATVIGNLACKEKVIQALRLRSSYGTTSG